jgi:lysophospholipase L1-like esterase
MKKKTIFERHPNITMFTILTLLSIVLYAFFSWKIFKNEFTENQSKSLKTILHQYYVGKIIDNNIGRFIALREYPVNKVIYDRPGMDIISNIAPNSIEHKHYKVSVDGNGFIGPSDIHENPDLKIVFLGGSTTECLYVDEFERFPYLTARLMEEKTNKKINSYNGGKSANESLHSINNLINKVLPLEPDYVVLMHNINDLVMLRLQGTYGYVGSLLSHVQSYKTLFTIYSYPFKEHNSSNQKMLDKFSQNLRMFVSISKINNIEPILMTQANRVFNDPMYHQFNQQIRDISNQEGVELIDLAKLVPQEPEFIYDSYHYTAKGSRLAASLISETLANKIS